MSNFSVNRFAVLGDDGDTPAPTSAPAKGAAPPVAKTIPGQASRKQLGENQASRGPRRQAGAGEGEPPLGGEPTNRDERGDRRGRGGFRGGDRGGFRGRGRGKSDRLDRHSATGTLDSEKKIAAGWGADEGNSELRAHTEADADVTAETTTPEIPAMNGIAEPVAEAPQEEEDKTKTFDEYLAERAATTSLGQFQVREANEGTDESQWKDGVELVRGATEEEDFFAGKTKKTPTAKKQVKEKIVLDVEPQGYRPPRDARGGDRGGRGRGSRGRGDGPPRGGERGAGRGRGGPRGGGRGQGTRGFDAADPSAFPSLS